MKKASQTAEEFIAENNITKADLEGFIKLAAQLEPSPIAFSLMWRSAREKLIKDGVKELKENIPENNPIAQGFAYSLLCHVLNSSVKTSEELLIVLKKQ